MSDRLMELVFSVEDLTFVPENGDRNNLMQVLARLADFLEYSGRGQAASAAWAFCRRIASYHLDETMSFEDDPDEDDPDEDDPDEDDPDEDDPDDTGATVTVMRGDEALTIRATHSWKVTSVMDTYGRNVNLTEDERAQALTLLNGGVDETGR